MWKKSASVAATAAVSLGYFGDKFAINSALCREDANQNEDLLERYREQQAEWEMAMADHRKQQVEWQKSAQDQKEKQREWDDAMDLYKQQLAAYEATSTLDVEHTANASPDNFGLRISKFLRDVKLVVGESQVDVDEAELQARGKPWNSYHSCTRIPNVILTPHTTEQVSGIMKLCHKYDIPVVPIGGGTSLEGQTLATYGGISLDFNSMKAIVELNEDDLDVTVQAGLGYVELNELLRDKGVWFPLDPGPGASIGGMCATRCSGSTAVRYGSMRENVLQLTAVLPDGTIVKTGTRARKSSAGYDLTRLFIGSEATLAVITEATLKIHPIPKHSYALRLSFPSVFEASCCARDTLKTGLSVGRLEMIDEIMVQDINKANPHLKGGAWKEEVTLLYELTGPSSTSVMEQIDYLKEVASKNKCSGIKVATDKEDVKQIWQIRKECLWSAMSVCPDLEPMITDVCVPLTKLPELIQETRKHTDASPLHCPMIAHAGDGNFHSLIMFDPKDLAQKAEAQRLADLMATNAIKLGGTCTGEHGVGVGKKKHLCNEAGDGSMKLMYIIKDAIDPLGILNPGKILDSHRRDEE